MHNGDCVSDNTFFQARELRGVANGLKCLLANESNIVTVTQGTWLYPDGETVDCTLSPTDMIPFGCSPTNGSEGTILFVYSDLESITDSFSGVYTCCLPSSCSHDNSNRITARIFSEFRLL